MKKRFAALTIAATTVAGLVLTAPPASASAQNVGLMQKTFVDNEGKSHTHKAWFNTDTVNHVARAYNSASGPSTYWWAQTRLYRDNDGYKLADTGFSSRMGLSTGYTHYTGTPSCYAGGFASTGQVWLYSNAWAWWDDGQPGFINPDEQYGMNSYAVLVAC
ncbi:MAG TPA: hypothetical protein VGX28_13810 [Frankiaceae bacterium]|jgi:hypothetical protein|nr:hypothetical protein [Frankiaceae bacterium]